MRETATLGWSTERLARVGAAKGNARVGGRALDHLLCFIKERSDREDALVEVFEGFERKVDILSIPHSPPSALQSRAAARCRAPASGRLGRRRESRARASIRSPGNQSRSRPTQRRHFYYRRTTQNTARQEAGRMAAPRNALQSRVGWRRRTKFSDSSDRRGLFASTASATQSASKRRTIRTQAITSRSCQSNARRDQFDRTRSNNCAAQTAPPRLQRGLFRHDGAAFGSSPCQCFACGRAGLSSGCSAAFVRNRELIRG